MTITLTPETEAKLRDKAQRDGQDLDRVADILLSDVLDAEALMAKPGKPIEQYLAEQSTKHGYPVTWSARNVVQEISHGVFVEKE